VVPPAIVAATWRGRTVPLHATSTGKVLMAFGDLPAVPSTGRRRLERFTDTTVTSRAALEEQLAQVRLRGFSTCRGELEDSAWGVSAPVKDRAGRLVAVLSIWGPGTRITDARLEVLGPQVHAAASTLLEGPP
jgi:DNA-binding IclR family transcriptional regulator